MENNISLYTETNMYWQQPTTKTPQQNALPTPVPQPNIHLLNTEHISKAVVPTRRSMLASTGTIAACQLETGTDHTDLPLH
jgi:hypothetical protein